MYLGSQHDQWPNRNEFKLMIYTQPDDTCISYKIIDEINQELTAKVIFSDIVTSYIHRAVSVV